MAGVALAKAGFAEIYHLSGGFRAWKDAGLPVESFA
jgi:rhodanese-related sulfurtransferase